jgi:hypothetical protein
VDLTRRIREWRVDRMTDRIARTSGRIAVCTTAPEMKGTPAAPHPLATRGHFYEDAQLDVLAREAGFDSSGVMRPDEGAQLLVARG